MFLLLIIVTVIVLSLSVCVISLARSLPSDLASPMLMEPGSETVVLTGKDSLTFKWYDALSHYPGKDYYDFRIYKGYQTVADTLIFKEKVPARTFRISVSTDLFKDGEIYSWSVRHVVGAAKSLRNFRSFKAVK